MKPKFAHTASRSRLQDAAHHPTQSNPKQQAQPSHNTANPASPLHRDATVRAVRRRNARTTLATVFRGAHGLLLGVGRGRGASGLVGGRVLEAAVVLVGGGHGCGGGGDGGGAGVGEGLVGVRDRGGRARAALDAPHDEEDPGDELGDAAEGEAGHRAVPHAVGEAAGVVVVVAVAAAGARGGPPADEAAADDEEEDGGDEEGDGPPLGEAALGWHRDGGGGRRRVGVGHVLAVVHFVGHFVVGYVPGGKERSLDAGSAGRMARNLNRK